MTQNMDPNDSQQAKAPTDALSLAGQSFGLDREKTFDLVLSLKTDSNALAKFAEHNADLPPEERLQALNELVPIAGSVEATNVLLEEAGKGAVARNALYLVGAAKEGTKLRFEPVEGKQSLLDAQFKADRRSLRNMKLVKNRLETSFSTMVNPSAEDVEVVVKQLRKLLPLQIAKAIDLEVQKAVTSAKADSTPVSEEALLLLRSACGDIVSDEINTLRARLIKNRKDESVAVSHEGSVEMSVWSRFADYFGIDTRDLSEARWGLLTKLRNACGGRSWTECCRRALEIGKDISSNNINDVIHRAERGFTVDFESMSVDDEEYERAEQEYDFERDEGTWDGSKGWT